METPQVPADALQGPGSLLKGAYTLMRSRYRSIIGLILVSTLGNILSQLSTAAQEAEESAMSFFRQFPAFSPASPGLSLAAQIGDASGALTVGIIIAAVVFVILVIFISVSVSVGLMTGFSRPEPLTSWLAFRAGTRNAGPFVLVSLLVGLTVVAGFILLIIPGIYWAVLYGLATWALVIEGTKGTAAMRRSKELVKGRWWKVAYRMGTIGLFNLLCYFVLGFIGGFIGVMAGAVPGAIVIGLAVGLLLTPLTLCYFVVLYRELARTHLLEQPAAASAAPAPQPAA